MPANGGTYKIGFTKTWETPILIKLTSTLQETEELSAAEREKLQQEIESKQLDVASIRNEVRVHSTSKATTKIWSPTRKVVAFMKPRFWRTLTIWSGFMS